MSLVFLVGVVTFDVVRMVLVNTVKIKKKVPIITHLKTFKDLELLAKVFPCASGGQSGMAALHSLLVHDLTSSEFLLLDYFHQ